MTLDKSIASVEPYRGAALNGAIRLSDRAWAVPTTWHNGQAGQDLKMVILHVDW